jgi:hypothetical protein
LIKFLLWSRGGWRIYLDGPASLAAQLTAHYRETATGKFDAHLVAERMFDHPLEIVHTSALPQERAKTRPLGRHLDGCRIGFDLGGSDRKVAALIDGTVVFSEETVWDPYYKPDPQYHFDGIMDSLSKAAAHLPRVDAIGGSAAGVYVNNHVKVGSLFRGVPDDVFNARVRDLFLDIQKRGTACLSRSSTTGRSRRSPARCRSERIRFSDRFRDEHRCRLCHARRKHHVVAERIGLRPDRLQSGRRQPTNGRRLRRRIPVFFSTMRRASDDGCRHRVPP